MLGQIGGVFMAVLPSAVYVPTYLSMTRSRDANEISAGVSLLLYVANVHRVQFWFGKRFTQVLLWQSCIMILAHILLLELSTRLRSGYALVALGASRKVIVSHSSLFLALLAYTVASSILTYVMADYPPFVELLGGVSVCVEAMMALPQVLDNMARKSTEGLSRGLVASWLAGDAFKTFFFLYDGSPLQFVCCGLAQIGIDLVIVWQMWAFHQKAKDR